MAINPIQLFQTGNTDFLQNLYNNGTNVITGILDKAIAIGRDNVNNQQRMQSDLFAMRQNETNLAQRRAENLTKEINGAQDRARGVYENDRNFGAQQDQLGIQNSRAAANDLFSQGLQTENFALNAANTAADNSRADRQLSLSEQQVASEQAARDKQSQFYRDLYATPTTDTNPVPPLLRPNAPASDSRGTLELKLQGAVKSQDANAARQIQGQLDALPADSFAKPPTRADARAEESLALRKSNAATAAQEKEIAGVVADTGAFVPQEATLPEEATDAQKAAAKAYDKDRVNSELNSAKNYTLTEYVDLVPNLSATQKAKRQQLWEYANGVQAGVATPTGRPTATRKFNPATGKIE